MENFELFEKFFAITGPDSIIQVGDTWTESDAQLSIECYRIPNTSAVVSPIRFLVYDSLSKKELRGFGVIVECNYATRLIGDKFKIFTYPHEFASDFSGILTWDSIRVAEVIKTVEQKINTGIENKKIFSKRKNAKMQFHALIVELARKCKK